MAAMAARQLAGRVAVVTGSTSGIGLGIARRLANAGADIVLNGFGDAQQVEGVKRELQRVAPGVRVFYHAADMRSAAEIKELVKQARAELGAVDIVVNNAGIQHVAPITEFPAGKWDDILAINLSAVFHMTQAALPGMLERKWGRIINIASVHGLVASEHKSAYVAAKHGVIGLTKVTALETAASNVTCNAICPGWVRTPLVEKQIEARAAERNMSIEAATADLIRQKQPNLRFAEADQLGDLAVFLCSDAAANITGTSLPMDGGWTAQ